MTHCQISSKVVQLVNIMLIFDISEYFILGCTRELNVKNISNASAQVLTVATTILIVIGILNQTWFNFRFYK